MANYFSYPTLDTSLDKGYEIFHYRTKQTSEIYVHTHQFYEVYYFISGSVTYRIEEYDYELQSGDILLIKAHLNHGPIFSTPIQTYERIILWISSALLSELSTHDSIATCFDHPDSACIKAGSIHHQKIASLLQELLDEQQLSFHPNTSFFRAQDYYKILLSHLLIILNRITLSHSTSKDTSAKHLITEVLSYLTTHLDEDLSLDDLAAEFYISKYHLSRQFKAVIGMSLYQYVLKQRLLKAQHLVHHGFSLTDACKSCGFKDYSSFFRAFKKEFGISPKSLKALPKESATVILPPHI